MCSELKILLLQQKCSPSPKVGNELNYSDIFRRHPLVFKPFILATLLICLSCSKQQSYPAAPQIGSNIVIDVTSLPLEVPTFFTYHFQGKNINYFILNLQGSVSSFLDACTSCYSFKQGYRCENGSIVCRHCDLKFSVYKLKQGLGSCFPIKIEGKMENGKYLIPLALLQAETSKF
jgi:uncharacterized membrane protein